MATRPSTPTAAALPAVAADIVTTREARRVASVMYGRVEAALR
jgi:hypothetical protein